MSQDTDALGYPDGITQADHIAHDMKMGRFPKQSSIEEFLAERNASRDTDALHPALVVDVQAHRDAAYQNGWDDGYAEGYGKAAALSRQPEGAGERRWRHRKRGTEYVEIGRGTSQCASRPILEDEQVVVYRGSDGRLWVRSAREFEDGRFEALRDPSPASDGAPT